MPRPMPRPPRNLLRAALLLAIVWGCSASRADEAETPYLEAGGRGEAAAEAERAEVRLGVGSQRESAREAQQETNRIAGRILEALAAAGIPKKQIQTSRLQLQPVYASRRSSGGQPDPPRIVGYRADNVVSVRIEDLARLGPAIDAGLGAGANRLEGVRFGVRDPEALRRRALAAAVRDAHAKARTMADALEVELGRVQSLHESGGGVRGAAMAARAAFAEADGAPTPVAPGEIRMQASARIRWAIEE